MFDILCFCKKTFTHLKFAKKSCGIFLTWNQTMKWYKSHKKCPSNTFFFCLKDQRLWRFCKCVQKCNFGTELYYQLSPFYHDFALWGQSFFGSWSWHFDYLCFSKGGLISESKSLWVQKGSKTILSSGLWFGSFFEPKWKTFWDQTTFNF